MKVKDGKKFSLDTLESARHFYSNEPQGHWEPRNLLENRKVLIFAIEELPIMQRGKGVRLQKYKDGGLSDVTTFSFDDGLSWLDPAGRTRTETDLDEWKSKRASAGKMAPRGFPRNNKF